MPLSPPSSRRALRHTRSINIQIFSRDDGFWEIDARLTDIKTHDVVLPCSVLPGNKPVHDLLIRLTVDAQLNVIDVETAFESVPFATFCNTIGDEYKKLIGLNLRKGFRKGIQERLSGLDGCTHLSELTSILPTAAIQAFAFDERGYRNESIGADVHGKPFELDNCHALKTDGSAVAIYYPKWSVARKP